MKHLFVIILFHFVFPSRGQDTVYNGRIGLLPLFPENYVSNIKGQFIITADSVSFTPEKTKHSKYKFLMGRNEIDEAMKWGAFFIPNPYFLPTMVKICLQDGSKLVFVARNRKEIVSILKEGSTTKDETK